MSKSQKLFVVVDPNDTHHIALERAIIVSSLMQGIKPKVHAFVAGLAAQTSHVSDRDATVFRHHQRLSFSGEVGHFGNDRFFLTAIQTQGLLLQNAPQGVPLGARDCSDQLFQENSICSGIAICAGVAIIKRFGV